LRPDDDLDAVVAAAATIKERKLYLLQVGRL
jgi:hypothetical protein